MANTGSNTTDIVFSAALSGFWNNNYIFVPNPVTGSFNSLYSGSVAYGDVDYNFSLPNDPIVQVFFASFGIFGIYLLYKILTKNKIIPQI